MLHLMKKNGIYFIQHSVSFMTLVTLYFYFIRQEFSSDGSYAGIMADPSGGRCAYRE